MFYMQYIKTYSNNGSQHWEMGYQSYNNKSLSNKFQIYNNDDYPRVIWATEAEFYIDSSDPANFDKLPSSGFYTWDLHAYKDDGSEYPLKWTTTNADPQPGKSVDCDVNVLGTTGTKITFPNNNGCDTSGYSRDWNSHCADYCGCNNNDGTAKVECDYCCHYDRLSSSCDRENGPTKTYQSSSSSSSSGSSSSFKECIDPYSRDYNTGCQSVGCNNADGTRKDKCDYCCAIIYDDPNVGYAYCDWKMPMTTSPTMNPQLQKHQLQRYHQHKSSPKHHHLKY